MYIPPIVTVIVVFVAFIVCGLFFYFLAKRWFDNQQKEQLLQMKIDERREMLKTVTPIRLQAYERMALFLERISPSSLVLRCYQPGMDMKLLQGVMTKNIRDEWEHNLSQQVYLSTELWTRIREAKDEMINLVNASAVNLAGQAVGESEEQAAAANDPTRLAASIFAASAQHSPCDAALEALHNEIHDIFG